MPEERWQEEIIRRLDILIALSLEQAEPDSKATITAKVHKLEDLGVAQAEIARILGKPSNYIGALLSARKRKKKAKVK